MSLSNLFNYETCGLKQEADGLTGSSRKEFVEMRKVVLGIETSPTFLSVQLEKRGDKPAEIVRNPLGNTDPHNQLKSGNAQIGTLEHGQSFGCFGWEFLFQHFEL